MPKCCICEQHFKFNGSSVGWEIKTQIGDNVCNDCEKEYLKQTKRKVLNTNNEQKHISQKDE